MSEEGGLLHMMTISPKWCSWEGWLNSLVHLGYVYGQNKLPTYSESPLSESESKWLTDGVNSDEISLTAQAQKI